LPTPTEVSIKSKTREIPPWKRVLPVALSPAAIAEEAELLVPSCQRAAAGTSPSIKEKQGLKYNNLPWQNPSCSIIPGKCVKN
jgi:hypothetical protein